MSAYNGDYGGSTRRRPRPQQQRGGGGGGGYDPYGRGDERGPAAPPPPRSSRRNRRRRDDDDDEPLFFRRLGLLQTTRRQEIFLLVALIGSAAAWYLTPLSDVVAEYVLRSIPVESDVQMGWEAMRTLGVKYPEAEDRWGVGKVGHRLVAALQSGGGGGYDGYYDASSSSKAPAWRNDVDGHRWSFGAVRADFANAFALPGGIVRVTDSLLTQIRPTEGELAALLGHEMGHVLHRHSQRREVKEKLTTTVLKALTYEDDDGYDESFGEAAGEILLKGAAWLGEKGFSRKDEYQADGAAWDILVETGMYDPRSVASMLGKLWSLEGGSGKTRWESTHPGTADRIRALQDKWDGLDWREQRRLSKYSRG
mmetsp:Transcript_44218/g.134639  ORF Transcript_44218/g.134639 Transcript_44218/m.134639 type:complete len:367 (-) Transcript_44218:242-1342(-)